MNKLKIFVLLNVIFLVIGGVGFVLNIPELLILALQPIIWFWFLADIYLDVAGSGGFIPGPNSLGIVFIILGTLFSLFLFYLLSGWLNEKISKH